MAYASIPDIRGMVSFKTIDDQSDPNLAEVTRMIDDISGEINMALGVAGYDAPISSSASDAFVWLRQLNAYGAAMRAEASSAKGEKSEHLAFLERQYSKKLEDLITGDVSLPGVSTNTDTSAPRAGGNATSMFTTCDDR